MNESTFLNRNLCEIDFSGADLRGAQFEKTTMIQCNLSSADLRGASFKLCELYGVNLSDAIFDTGTRFDGSTFVEAVGLTPSTRGIIEQNGGTFQPLGASER